MPSFEAIQELLIAIRNRLHARWKRPVLILLACYVVMADICLGQFVLTLVSTLWGVHTWWCPLISVTVGVVFVQCDSCAVESMSGGSAFLLSAGIAGSVTGLVAALGRSSSLARIYGIAMLILGLILAFSSLLTGMEVPVMQSAVATVADPVCHGRADNMVSVTQAKALLFALSCVLTIVGAVYAIKSREYFEFEAIGEHHAAFHQDESVL